MPIPVALRAVSKSYDGSSAVSDVSLELIPGRILCLLGENGAGKSTVLKLLTGVVQPSSGEVLIDGSPVTFKSPRHSRAVGIAAVYQDIGTLPLMSVTRNFVLGTELTKGRGPFRRMDHANAERVALDAMRQLGISRIVNGGQLAGTMSGGERQALAIARAVHFGARVLLLDEPTAALGVRESEVVLRVIDNVRQRGVSVMFITHNPYHALAIGDYFMVLHRGNTIASFEKGQLELAELVALMSGEAPDESDTPLSGDER